MTPGRAARCPELRPASANSGPRPAMLGLVSTCVVTEPLVVLQVVVTVPMEADRAHLRVARADHLRPPLSTRTFRIKVRPPRVELEDRQREALQRRARRRIGAHPVRRVGAIGDAGHGCLRRHLEIRCLAVGDQCRHRRLGDHAVPHARPVVASATYRSAPVLVKRKLVLVGVGLSVGRHERRRVGESWSNVLKDDPVCTADFA